MDHIPYQSTVCARDATRFLISIKISNRKQASLGEFGFTKSVSFSILIFLLKKSASDCLYIVLIFRAISASMFLLSLFLIEKKSAPAVSAECFKYGTCPR